MHETLYKNEQKKYEKIVVKLERKNFSDVL